MAKMILLKQDAIESINIINKLKIDNMYVVLEEYNGFSSIAQYSSKYDTFRIVTVQSENLDRSKELKSAQDEA